MFGTLKQTEIGTFSPTTAETKTHRHENRLVVNAPDIDMMPFVSIFNPFVMAYYGQYHRHIPLTRAHRHSGIPKHI